MDNKSFFENIKRDTNTALSKVFNKVEEVSKTSALKLKIYNLKGNIKNYKTKIGEFIVLNKKKFSEFPEIIDLLAKIKQLEKQIETNKEQIEIIQEKDNREAAVKEDEGRAS